MSLFKPLGKDILIYGVGLAASKGLTFFLIPLLTRIFSPAEYGVLEMFATISGIIATVMTMGLDSAQTFFFMEAKNKGTSNSKSINASILHLRLLIGLAVIILVTVSAPLVVAISFNEPVPLSYLLLVVLETFFASVIAQSMNIFRLLYKSYHYVFLSLFQSIFSISFIVLFVVVFEMRLKGYFIGMMLAGFVAVTIGIISTRKYQSWMTFEPRLWLSFLKFGVPLLPASLMIWIMQASDRWFIMKLKGSDDLGLYAIGAKFSLFIVFFVEAFRRSFLPHAVDALYKDDGPSFLRKVALWYVTLGSVASVILAIAAPFLVKFIAAAEYYESWKITGVLCWSSFFYGFYMISGLGIFQSKKTYLSNIVYFIGALLNISLNYLLIPEIGLLGAAIATSFSIMVSNIASMILSNRYYEIKWDWTYYAVTMLISWSIICFTLFFYS